jgi:transposase
LPEIITGAISLASPISGKPDMRATAGRPPRAVGAEDAVVMEVGMGSFWWADKIESRGASCYVIDPYRFRIIKDSWNKTDKHDSRTMAKALWVQTVSVEFGLPVVWKPTVLFRELRKLFAQYTDLNVHICMLKNRVQSLAVENGITLTSMQKKELLRPRTGTEALGKLELSDASRLAVRMNQEILWGVVKQKELLAQETLRMGSPLAKEVKLLLTIKGVTLAWSPGCARAGRRVALGTSTERLEASPEHC